MIGSPLAPAPPRCAARWELFEQGQPHKISQGTSDYFKCTNKGCDTSDPISLYLAKPHKVPTDFKIEFTTVIPSATTSGHYTLVVWGEGACRRPSASRAGSLSARLTSTHTPCRPGPLAL